MARTERVRAEPETDLRKAREEIAQIGKRDFLEQLNQLTREYAQDPGNPNSYACEGCTRCANCMFCKGCDGCYQCTHCVQCEQCNNCSHCQQSKFLQSSAYCVQSEHCAHSAYLVMCRNLSDCNYCFGCVGLSKKDFHILNVPFARTEYFQIVGKLKRELGL